MSILQKILTLALAGPLIRPASCTPWCPSGWQFQDVSTPSTPAANSARFQLEFVFRDAKHHRGLTTGQLRSRQGLENHWNASFFSLSLARAALVLEEAGRTGRPASWLVCSIEDVKRRAFNVLFARQLLANPGLSQRFAELQNHPPGRLTWASRPLETVRIIDKGRHVVECNINRFKDSRALATRYEKRGHQFLAAVHAACIILWL
jgi:hypothetical protein